MRRAGAAARLSQNDRVLAGGITGVKAGRSDGGLASAVTLTTTQRLRFYLPPVRPKAPRPASAGAKKKHRPFRPVLLNSSARARDPRHFSSHSLHDQLAAHADARVRGEGAEERILAGVELDRDLIGLPRPEELRVRDHLILERRRDVVGVLRRRRRRRTRERILAGLEEYEIMAHRLLRQRAGVRQGEFDF